MNVPSTPRSTGKKIEDILPLGPLQEGLLFHTELAGTGHYVVQLLVDLEGIVDVPRLHAAAQALVDRNATLRAAFRRRKTGEPVQTILRNATVPWRVADTDVADEERLRPFDVTKPPLVRFALTGNRLVITLHHLVVDGWSLPLLVRELMDLYAGTDLPPAPHYRDYLAWVAAQDRDASIEAWTRALSDVDEATHLFPHTEASTGALPNILTREIPPALLADLRALARDTDVTLNTVIQTAWGILLSALTGRADAVFGATVSGRPAGLPGVESMIGLFINTIPVHVRARGTIREILTRVQATQAALLDHHHIPLADIHTLASPGGDLFDTLLVFENYPLDPDSLPTTPDLRVTSVTGRDATHYPLTLVALPGTGLTLEWVHRADVLPTAEAATIADRFTRVLTHIATTPDAPVATVDILTPDERAQLLTTWNATDHPVTPTTAATLFERQADRVPNAPAVITPTETLTYADLNTQATALAATLTATGVGPESIVGVALPRSPQWVVAMLATWKAGAAYLPLDPAYPTDRLTYVITDAAPTKVITTPDIATRLSLDPHVALFNNPTSEPSNDHTIEQSAHPDHPAWIIYTSGSTGRPKGVVVPHTGIASLVAVFNQTVPSGPGDRVLQFASPSFDVTFAELAQSLFSGAAWVIVPAEQRTGAALAEFAATHDLTHLTIPPSVLATIPDNALPPTASLVIGTEEVPADLVGRWAAGRTMVNAYGPTEVTVNSTFWHCEPTYKGRRLPIGQPDLNTKAYVLDHALRPVLPGIPGELYLSGDGLARGYHNRPDLTAERFIANPFEPGTRMYRTGDLVRWRNNGTLDFLGRTDHQVKIRGFRIEPGEIEAVLATHPQVAAAIVLPHDTPTDRRLVAYVTPHLTTPLPTPTPPDTFTTALPHPAPLLDPNPSSPTSNPHPSPLHDPNPPTPTSDHSPSTPPDLSALHDPNAPTPTSAHSPNPLTHPSPVHGPNAPTSTHSSNALHSSPPHHPDAPAPTSDHSPSALHPSPLHAPTTASAHSSSAVPHPSPLHGPDAPTPTPHRSPSAVPSLLHGPHTPAPSASASPSDSTGSRATREPSPTVDDSTGAPTPADLRAHLAAHLPAHMVPSVFVVLDRLPTLPNGKVDRKALPSPEATPAVVGRAPRDPREHLLAELFADVLGVPAVGIDDDFFHLGGHSLLATRLISRVRSVFGADTSLRALFDAPTVAALAGTLAPGSGRPAPTRTDELTTSAAQRRLLIQLAADGPTALYSVPIALTFSAPLDPAALAEAVGDVVTRHEVLRTIYPTTDTPSVLPPASVTLQVQAGDPTDLARTPIDPRVEPPVRFHLLPDHRTLVVVLHHIAVDEWSMGVLLHDLAMAYRARNANTSPTWTDLPIGYTDYAAWQRDLLGTPDDPESLMSKQGAYWSTTLTGLTEQLDLPTDHPRPPVASSAGATVEFEVPPALRDAMRATARSAGVSAFMVLHAAVAALFTRLGAGTDISLGTPVAGRSDATLDDIVGFFVNSVVLRANTSDDPTFADLLTHVRDVDLTAFDNADIPFDRVVELVNPTRSAARHPLFQTMIAFNHASDTSLDWGGPTATVSEQDTATAKFDLSISLTEHRHDNRITGHIEYRTDLFAPATVTTLATRLLRLLTDATAAPKRRLSELAVLSDEERTRVLTTWNATDHPVIPTTAATLFETQARRAPDATAVIADDATLTYAELDARAAALAATLIARTAGSPEPVIGVALPRSAAWVTAMLATWKAGAAYLPLDPTYPTPRLTHIIGDAAPSLVITTPDIAARLSLGQQQALFIPPSTDLLATSTSTRPTHPDTPAWIIYTSGSTGRPKGVTVPHTGLASLVAVFNQTVPSGPGDRVLQFASPSFDVTFAELAQSLFSGATWVIVPAEQRAGDGLAEFARQHDLTHLTIPPSVLATLPDNSLPPTASLVIGTEEVPADLVSRWAAGRTMVNAYGPTEVTVNSTFWHCEPTYTGRRLPIGQPDLNTKAYVLDNHLNPVPPGVSGELYLSGDGLARGYHNRPDLTAERFIANPFQPGTRMYRTGDLVRWRNNGTLDFLGRTDHQTKIRGFRIELGEIEATLTDHPAVERALVIVHEHEDRKRIVAYVVAPDGVDQTRLRAHVADRLPDYMVPSAFVHLDALPLLPNGKPDRRALPEPDFGATRGRGPRDDRESVLAALFADVLDVPDIGAEDDFFQSGGHSLLAIRLISRIRDTFGVSLSLRTLFDAPTVARLAPHLASGTNRPAPRKRSSVDERVLSAAQRRLLFHFVAEGPSPTYNVPIALRLSDRPNVPALRAALADVAERHEILRTIYPESHGEHTAQVIDSAPELVVTGDLSGASTHPFDLTAELPIRAWLSDDTLLIVLHHIAVDEWSTGPLLRDLDTAYRARLTNQAPQWSPLPVDYADYAAWQQDLLGDETDPTSLAARQVDHWRTALRGLPDQIELPTDRPRPPVASNRGATVTLSLGEPERQALHRLAREHGVSVFMVVQAAVAALLSRLGAGNDIPIGTPVAGRSDAALDDVVGFFVNTLVLRADTSGDPTFAELLTRVRATALAAFDNADIPFERVVEAVNPPRSAAYHPLFQVMVAHGRAGASPTLGDLTAEPLATTSGTAKFDLAISLFDEESGMSGQIEYRTDLFDEDSVLTLAARLIAVLRTAATTPTTRISTLDLLTPQERTQVLTTWNATDHPVTPTTAATLFERQADRVPNAPAVITPTETLTYADLNTQATALAATLTATGVGPESIVGVALPRSPQWVVAMLATWKAGAAYLPLDPAYPTDRLTYVINDARPTKVITTPHIAAQLSLDPHVVLFNNPTSEPLNDHTIEQSVHPDHPAWIIYTSGSTGRPKGVVVPHAGIASLVAVFNQTVPSGPGDRVLQFASPSFDVTFAELAQSLFSGAAWVIVPPEQRAGEGLAEFAREHDLTHLTIPPSVLTTIPDGTLPPTASLVIGTEEVPADLVSRWAAGRTMVNAYGPTEVTVNSTFWHCEPTYEGRRLPIGKPDFNTRAYVLDPSFNPVPPGVPGELYLSGDGLARGYHNRPDLTAERFVANPFEPGTRMYRTGDLVRWRNNGTLDFLGRTDHQVKIRGFRIEPGEIEAVLGNHPNVAKSTVLARDTPTGKQLVAYVVSTQDTATLRAHTAAHLPDYMVPSAFVHLEALPLLPNGKLDRSALPEPEPEPADHGGRPARTVTEQVIRDLYSDVLGRPVGVEGNFFEHGGHSLLLVSLRARVTAATGAKPSVADLLAHPSPAALAAHLDGEGTGTSAHDVLLPLRTRGSKAPLFCVHALYGFAWQYAALLPHIDSDRPVYGIQAVGLNGEARLPASLDDMAAEYARRIREVQPDGPYHLLGYSFGGVVAHKLATELGDVATLVMVDAYPLTDEERADSADEDEDTVRAFLDRAGGLAATIEDDRLPAVAAVARNAERVMREGRLSPFEGDLLHIGATGDKAGTTLTYRRWAPLVTGEVRHGTVACDHIAVTEPDQVRRWAPLVDDALRESGA